MNRLRSSGNIARILHWASAALLMVVVATWAPANGQDSGGPPSWQELTRDYAQTAAQLAEARLADAVAMNRTMPTTIPSQQVDRLKRLSAEAQARARALQPGSMVDASVTLAALAEIAVASAEQEYAKLQQASQLNALDLPQELLGLAKTRLRFAQARLALAKALKDQPAEVRLQWQFQMLLDELIEIRGAIDRLEQRE